MLLHHIRFVPALIFVSSLSAVIVSTAVSSRRTEIFYRLFRDYHKFELPPTKEDKPVKVEVSVYIVSINPPDVGKEELTVNIFLRQKWHDDRLSWEKWRLGNGHKSPSFINLPRDNVWLPDLFVENGRMEKTPNFKLTARSNGDITFSEQVAITASCPLSYYHYPIDQQNCILKFRAYSLSLADQRLMWHPTSNVSINVDLHLTSYDIPRTADAVFYKTLYTTGAVANLDLKFNFTRKSDVHIMSAYLPSYVMISASWIQFFLERELLGIRILFSLIIFLGILFQLNFISVPAISALHIWLTCCAILAFANLCESGIIAIIEGKAKKRVKVEKIVERPSGQGPISALPNESTGLRRESKAIDFISAAFFPVIFVLFNVFYWLYFAVLR